MIKSSGGEYGTGKKKKHEKENNVNYEGKYSLELNKLFSNNAEPSATRGCLVGMPDSLQSIKS